MKQGESKSGIFLFGSGFLLLGVIAVLVSLSSINNISKDQEINGLGDVAYVSCDEIAAVDDMFDTYLSDPACQDDPDYAAIEYLQGELTKWKTVKLVGIGSSALGVLLVIISLFPSKPKSSKLKAASQTKISVGERLNELDNLKSKGLISESEYELQRNRVINSL